jgi:hypothetical protein
MRTALYGDSVRSIRTAGRLVSFPHKIAVVTINPLNSPNLICSKEAPDPSLRDAVCAIIYAAPHTELKGEKPRRLLAKLTTQAQ